MYKPPFQTFKQPKADPMQPLAARVGPKATPGSRVFDCPTIKKVGTAPAQQAPKVQLVDHRKVRQQASNIDRRKEIIDTPMVDMSQQADGDNAAFIQETLPEAKMHEFWVFPEECTSVFMDKRNGLAYANVCIIGINGKQWPLFPGNNRAPGFVYEALCDHRDLRERYKSKIAPPKASGRSINFSDPRSGLSGKLGGGNMVSNQQIFNDSMLGRPNVFDSSRNSQAANLIRQHREQFFKPR